MPIELFDDLLSAFKQDVHTTRYAGWEDVLDYCRRSANPVGRLVLRLAGVITHRKEGTRCFVALRPELEGTFPGLLASILRFSMQAR